MTAPNTTATAPAMNMTGWEQFDEFMQRHMDELRQQRKGFNVALYNAALEEFGDRLPTEQVFRHITSFYRSINGIERTYQANNHYTATPRRRAPRQPIPPIVRVMPTIE
jgi:hypothetical protein